MMPAAEPDTLAGVVAKARAAALEAALPDGGVDFDQPLASQWAGQVTADLLRLMPSAT